MARRIARRAIKKLPSLPLPWHVLVYRMRIWIAPEDEPPHRPYMVVVINLGNGMLQQTELVDDPPNADELLYMLTQAMREPMPGPDVEAHRPVFIQFEDEGYVERLADELKGFEIEVQHAPRPEGVDDMLRDMESYLRQGPELPGLLSIRGVTKVLLASFFAAAASFYRAEPWIHLSDQDTFAITVPPEKKTRFAQVMGGGGVTYGLAMYRIWKDVERLFGFAENAMETLPPGGGHSFTYGSIAEFPFDDLDALEDNNWEIADEQAYPTPLVFTRNGEVRRPKRADLLWYEGALLALPIFVEQHLEAIKKADSGPSPQGGPVEGTVTVKTHKGEKVVHIKFPGGTLPRETRPVHLGDWPDPDSFDDDDLPQIDMRSMESTLAQIGGPPDESDLGRAQDLMYHAWDEANPGRRIILAHEALEVSPLCADAYVLLAEEEADTLGRALEYYRLGVEAGQQALGADFEEYRGHFWGVLETRPYMRARQGLANVLWEMDQYDEAANHFTEMLQLNPNDNQGVRYSLLNLLLSAGRDDEARKLQKRFQDDVMAEWLYTRALLEFRATGAGKKADRLLKMALEENPHVPVYLTGSKRIPIHLPATMSWGDDSEAVHYASVYLPHWRRTAGAIDWLKKRTGTGRGKTRRK